VTAFDSREAPAGTDLKVGEGSFQQGDKIDWNHPTGAGTRSSPPGSRRGPGSSDVMVPLMSETRMKIPA
jgi:hypothetical protein